MSSNVTVTLAAGVTVTAAGPVAGSAQPTSSLSANYTLYLSSGPQAGSRLRIGIEDSPDGTTWMPIAVWEIPGPVTSGSAFGERYYTAPGLAVSPTSQARLNVYDIAGSAMINASISSN